MRTTLWQPGTCCLLPGSPAALNNRRLLREKSSWKWQERGRGHDKGTGLSDFVYFRFPQLRCLMGDLADLSSRNELSACCVAVRSQKGLTHYPSHPCRAWGKKKSHVMGNPAVRTVVGSCRTQIRSKAQYLTHFAVTPRSLISLGLDFLLKKSRSGCHDFCLSFFPPPLFCLSDDFGCSTLLKCTFRL